MERLSTEEVEFKKLETTYDWDTVAEALECLRSYLVKHDPHAELTIESLSEAIEALPRDDW